MSEHPFWRLLRFLACWSFALCTLPVLWILVPLRPVHIVLRRLGVQNGRLPLDLAAQLWSKLVVHISGVRMVKRKAGMGHTGQTSGAILMVNHSSSLDAFVTMACTDLAPKAIFKRSLMWICPPIFLLAYFYGHVPIARGNHSKAVRAIDRAVSKLLQFSRTVLIFPEGTRSADGKLQPFKKGGFHLAFQSGAPILPALILDAHRLYDRGSFFARSGTVTWLELPAITFDPSKSTVEEVLEKTRSVMAKALADHKPPGDWNRGTSLVWPICWLTFLSLVLLYIFPL